MRWRFVPETSAACYDVPDELPCLYYTEGCGCPPISPNPDIARVGVIASFATAATITFVVYLTALLLALAGTEGQDPLDRLITNVFQSTINLIQKHVSSKAHLNKKRWGAVCLQILLGLSNHHLLTCLAILITAFVRMVKGCMTVYHFTICLDLAWFSPNIHSMTLVILSAHLQQRPRRLQRIDMLGQQKRPSRGLHPRRERFPALTGLRMVLMIACSIILITGQVITGHRNWDSLYTCPVNCVRQDLYTNFG